MKIELNINEKIKFKLTENGKMVMKKHFKYIDFSGPNALEYYTFSIWEFASIFGKEFHNGQPNQSIVDNKIIICR